jgi:hypothetical protein
MGSSLSSQPAPKTESIQKGTQLTCLLTLPTDILTKILEFLDIHFRLSCIPRVCWFFREFCWQYIKKLCSRPTHIGHFYESLLFSKGDPIIYLIPKDTRPERYFLSNVDFSFLTGIERSTVIRAHIFLPTNSKQFQSNDVVSMVIALHESKDIPRYEGHGMASNFLDKLFEYSFGNLKSLKLSGILVNRLLWKSLFKLRLDWLHLTRPSFGYFSYENNSFLGFKKLHVEFTEDCDLPFLPCLLEEISLHFTYLNKKVFKLNTIHCHRLKRM